MGRPGLIVICGPTATGKSRLAIALAQHLHTIILSADSRQVYREFDIGTAKPSLTERASVPHHLIDMCEPTATLTVADYQAQAQQLIQQYHNSHQSYRVPLLVGGTGLYIRAVTQGLKIPRVSPQPPLRQQLQALGQPHCYQLLRQVDPTAAQRIHPHDQVRTLRALEVFYATGQPISTQQGENPPPYAILYIGLDCRARDALSRRIEQRTAQMIAAGFVTEVAVLIRKYGPALPLLDTLGYREMKQYLAGQISLEQAQALIVRHTRQFAKRQQTWFRALPDINWFDADSPNLQEQVWTWTQQFLNRDV